ncbi:13457_t:CDS:2 [Funneliformis geosporum]|nr:13457_t:CDS:2 [Funneliformis geosporum]
MSNSNSTFRSITPKLQEFFIQNPNIIALTTSNSSVLHFNSLPLVDPTTNITTTLVKPKIHKKKSKKGFLVNGFSNNVELFNSFEEKQESKENPIKIKNDQQFEKKQIVEKEAREAEMIYKKEELAIEKFKAETLQKKMEFDINHAWNFSLE